jgi:hypothetical protein
LYISVLISGGSVLKKGGLGVVLRLFDGCSYLNKLINLLTASHLVDRFYIPLHCPFLSDMRALAGEIEGVKSKSERQAISSEMRFTARELRVVERKSEKQATSSDMRFLASEPGVAESKSERQGTCSEMRVLAGELEL